jgi:NADH-quinone oxidoreductase subunit C
LSEDKQALIDDAVDKALAGDMDPINNIEDRVTRSKAKAALVKAKRAKPKTEIKSDASVIHEGSNTKSKDTIEQIVMTSLAKSFSDFLDGEQNSGWIQIKAENWFGIAKWLKENDDLYFDSLQCNTGIDLGEGMLESRYNLHSMKHLHAIEIRIKVSIEKPDIPSVESLWRVADWFERETYDMFGINFTGHRDLRRILLPEDWEGWPLRKDYEEQETYHGIVVPKVKEGWE